ncbi:MAG: P13 family porin [Pleomorphochaeta sp.]
MKKNIIFFILVLIIPLETVVAEDSTSQDFYKASMLLSSLDNVEESELANISKLTIDFSPMEKNMLYESNKQSTTIPFLINFLVGFGVGSYIQGDKTGGNTALACDLLSLTAIYIGYAQALSSIYDSSYTGSEGSTLLVLGSIGYLATRIYELIRPFNYAKSYNQKLTQTLMAFSVEPDITEYDDLELSLSYKIKL